jgi:two-component system, OmpR family, response regulator
MGETGHRILVVDDEESIRRGLRAYLEDDGFEVIIVESGEEGMEVLKREATDGAIVDIRLPGMDGGAFMERAHELRPEMKFLVYTGSVGYSPPSSLDAVGVSEDSVFKKPVMDMSVLAAALRRLFQDGRDG